ncbi:hypothetical protein IAQ61_004905 [Plenodomus lingam]|uniref:uncharacterized protein n=1 Tax=Leptosphaeria maculans TaxID=5022 RepID=UPI00331BC77E|nr:hypothetical protein IAQ61_004905 [Plenodomus lingam]
MKSSTFVLALAGLLALVTADSSCRAGEKWCSNSTTAVYCNYDHEEFLFTCPDGQHCEVMKHRPMAYCREGSPDVTTAPYSAPTASPKAIEAVGAVDFAKTSNEFADNNELIEDDVSIYDDVDEPVDDNELTEENEPINNNDLTTESKPCLEGTQWKHRHECYKCENAKQQRTRRCRRHYACSLSDGKPGCIRSSPNDGWRARNIRNTVEAINISNLANSSNEKDEPVYKDPVDVATTATTSIEIPDDKNISSEGNTCSPGTQWTWLEECWECENGRQKLMRRCRRHFECKLQAGKPSCSRTPPNNDRRALDTLDPTNPDPDPALAPKTTPTNIHTIQRPKRNLDTTTGISTQANTFCGICTSMRGLNAELRTSNYSCRNHHDLDGEYYTCRNMWCGLCVLFAERDCQGDIKWSGGPGEGTGDKKGNHAKSHFCM